MLALSLFSLLELWYWESPCPAWEDPLAWSLAEILIRGDAGMALAKELERLEWVVPVSG